MFIRFGTKLYGKVDVIPGLGFVSTRFFHVMLLPLFPLGCWFVEEGSEGPDADGNPGWKGAAIPFCAKSVLFAYGRVAAMIGSFIFGLMALPGLNHGPVKGWPAGILAALCATAVILSYRFNRASLPRAVELAGMVGVPGEEVERRFAGRRR